jgi:hypothetical protein
MKIHKLPQGEGLTLQQFFDKENTFKLRFLRFLLGVVYCVGLGGSTKAHSLLSSYYIRQLPKLKELNQSDRERILTDLYDIPPNSANIQAV